ncbi:hypothetical protein H0H93_010945 [Arthromyces matolae]|nr:hypothetical protein H0H93_010945 [Arthromyces matolae]
MSVLRRHSQFFRDMFSIPQPKTAKDIAFQEIEGDINIPVVDLHDSAEDVGNLLKAVYDGPIFGNNDQEDFRMVSGVLRLSTKYLIDTLRVQALAHLSKAWPPSLEGWDVREDFVGILDACSSGYPHPIAVINLAREVDAPSLLPAAFYDLSRHSFSHIFESTEEDQTRRPLPPAPSSLSNADLERLCLGREASQQALASLITALGNTQHVRTAQLLSSNQHARPAKLHSRQGSHSAVCMSAAACRKDFSELVDLATHHYLLDRKLGCYDPLYVAEELGQLDSAEFSECKACARFLEVWAAREREKIFTDVHKHLTFFHSYFEMQLSASFVFLSLLAGAYSAPIFTKRIAQDISASTTQWEQACVTAGGGLQCNPLSVTAFSTLLIAPGPCEQQDAADQMIDLAKQLNNDADMIRLTQIFAQQPRNTPDSLSVPYCQQAPKNSELNGLFQCQFAGADPKNFVGGLTVGQTGTIPFGKTSAVSPAGSCPAHTSGPIADGTQLIDIVQDPGVGTTTSGSSSTSSATTVASAAASSSNSSSKKTSKAKKTSKKTSSANTSSSTSSTATTTTSAAASSDFHLQNGLDAQALNAKFATLTTTSSCNEGDQACINGGFAQCVQGQFVISTCGSLTCFALPLVNSAGTSITCDTEADALARIAATGATGGLTGNGQTATSGSSSSATTAADVAVSTASSTTSSTSSSSDFHLQNGEDAQALNAQFATLTTSSTCNEGDDACINGGFAQCVGGQFVINSCGSSLSCFALPLVNSAGTSLACTTEADAEARIAATGATGGIAGNGQVAAVASTSSSTSNSAKKAKSTTSTAASASSTTASSTTTTSSTGDFHLQNGLDAQALNAKFATLTANSSCNEGDQACINGGFAQCVQGKFVISSCGSLTCFALPLVNSAGTSITCDTQSDALTRIAATGATGGLTGA